MVDRDEEKRQTHEILPHHPPDEDPNEPASDVPVVCPLKEVRDVPREARGLPSGVEPRVEEKEDPPEPAPKEGMPTHRSFANSFLFFGCLVFAEDGCVGSAAEGNEELSELQTKIWNENLDSERMGSGARQFGPSIRSQTMIKSRVAHELNHAFVQLGRSHTGPRASLREDALLLKEGVASRRLHNRRPPPSETVEVLGEGRAWGYGMSECL